jgi:hypothetical protein
MAKQYHVSLSTAHLCWSMARPRHFGIQILISDSVLASAQDVEVLLDQAQVNAVLEPVLKPLFSSFLLLMS